MARSWSRSVLVDGGPTLELPTGGRSSASPPPRLEQLVDHVAGVVLQLVPGAALLPFLEPDLAGAGHVALEDAIQLLRQGRVQDRERDLVVGVERAVVEVGRADRAP